MEVRPDPLTGTVHLTTSAPHPGLAEQINRRLLDLAQQFNVERRQTTAGAEREFVEGRLEAALAELSASEADLERFLEENRRYQESPQLTFRHGTLMRRVALRQQVYTSLAEAYEQARIDEARNTPLFTVVDSPEGSESRRRPNLLILVPIAFIAGLFLATFVTLLLEGLARQRRENPGEYAEFLSLVGSSDANGGRTLPESKADGHVG
jgi:uncharacterized protein involved in exopolysaccharide biosynthesis